MTQIDYRAPDASNPFIRRLERFAVLSDEDRTTLAKISAEPRLIGARTDLIREGDDPDGALLVMEGMACRYKQRAGGQRHIVAYLLPGDLVNLDVVLLKKMDHTISTMSACKVVRLAPKTITDILEHHPAIVLALRTSTLVDEAILRAWLVSIGCRSAVERIAHLFCELLLRLQAVGLVSNNSYDLPITQMDLADTLGLSSVHMNRSLQELRRMGLIELTNRRLTILDMPQLKAIAEFNAYYLQLEKQ